MLEQTNLIHQILPIRIAEGHKISIFFFDIFEAQPQDQWSSLCSMGLIWYGLMETLWFLASAECPQSHLQENPTAAGHGFWSLRADPVAINTSKRYRGQRNIWVFRCFFVKKTGFVTFVCVCIPLYTHIQCHFVRLLYPHVWHKRLKYYTHQGLPKSLENSKMWAWKPT